MKYAVCFVLLALIAGCAPTPPAIQTPQEKTQLVQMHNRELFPSSLKPSPIRDVSTPELNAVSHVEVGQSMLTTAKKEIVRAIKLDQDVFYSTPTKSVTLTIPAGVLRLQGWDANGDFYQTQDAIKLNLDGSLLSVRAGLYVPRNLASSIEAYWIPPLTPSKSVNYPLNRPDLKVTPVEEWGTKSFKRELIYSGISQGTISVLYREFKEDIARPAFSQELKYDLSEGKVIGYRGARFEVIKADNLGLRYRVTKHLE